jgi:hypothetical protein
MHPLGEALLASGRERFALWHALRLRRKIQPERWK